jgi:hypothetical protein
MLECGWVVVVWVERLEHDVLRGSLLFSSKFVATDGV